MKYFIIYKYFFILIMLISINGIFAQTPVHLSSITQNLKTPIRIAIDNTDRMYVTDATQKLIVKYDASGNFMETITSDITPVSIAINKGNQIFIGDGETGNILKLNSNGTADLMYSGAVFPTSMLFGPDELLYVVDSKLRQVIVLDQSGTVIRTIGNGTFTYPTGIAYNPKNNRILVSEHGGMGDGFNPLVKVWMFELSGNFIGSFGSQGSTNGKFYRIEGLDVDRCGNIYVSDPFQGNISVFNEDGVFISKFGDWGNTLGKLNVPLDIAIDSKDNICITSMNNSAIENYKIKFDLPTSNITTGNSTICSSDTSSVKIHVAFTGTSPWSFTYTIDDLNPTTKSNITNNPYLLNVVKPGTYKITALSDSEKTGTCFSGSSRITIDSIIPTLKITSGNTTICAGEEAPIPVYFTGTSPWSFTYMVNSLNPTTISNVINNPYILKLTQAGTYQITSLSGVGCKGSNISESAQIFINPSSRGYDTASFCLGGSYTFGSQILTQAGKYTEKFISANGCDSLVNLVLNTNPPLKGIENVSICQGRTYNFGKQVLSSTGRYNETYKTLFGCDSIVTLNLLVNPPLTVSQRAVMCLGDSYTFGTQTLTAAGIYQEIFTSATSCDSIVTLTLIANPVPKGTVTATICQGDSYTFSTKKITTAGTYTERFALINSCDSIAILTLHVNGLPVVNLGRDTIICEGKTLTLDAGSSFAHYLWNDTSIRQTLKASTPGKYSITVTDSNGCKNSDELIISLSPLPVPLFTYTANSLDVNFVNNTLNSTDFLWNFGDGTFSKEINPVHNYQNPGDYIVKLTATDIQCSDSISISESINILVMQIGRININNIATIYPNPSKGHITIEIEKSIQSDIKIEISNTCAQKIYTKDFNSKNNIEQIDLSDFSNGIYTIRITAKDFTKTHKLVLCD